MITIRKYSPNDKIDNAEEPFMPFYNPDEHSERSLALTVFDDNVAMVCGGIVCVNDTDGIVWVTVSTKCRKQPYRWARTIREFFDIIIRALGYMTIITYILADYCKGEKLAKLIGMSKSGEVYEYNGHVYNKYMVIT